MPGYSDIPCCVVQRDWEKIITYASQTLADGIRTQRKIFALLRLGLREKVNLSMAHKTRKLTLRSLSSFLSISSSSPRMLTELPFEVGLLRIEAKVGRTTPSMTSLRRFDGRIGSICKSRGSSFTTTWEKSPSSRMVRGEPKGQPKGEAEPCRVLAASFSPYMKNLTRRVSALEASPEGMINGVDALDLTTF